MALEGWFKTNRNFCFSGLCPQCGWGSETPGRIINNDGAEVLIVVNEKFDLPEKHSGVLEREI